MIPTQKREKRDLEFLDIARNTVAQLVRATGADELAHYVSELARSYFRLVNLETLVERGTTRELTETFALVNWRRRERSLATGDPIRDWIKAEGYVAYLYAESVFESLPVHTDCPAELLCDENGGLSDMRIGFLSGLTLDEFIRNRADEIWQSASRPDQKGPVADYFGALNDFRNQVVMAMAHGPRISAAKCQAVLGDRLSRRQGRRSSLWSPANTLTLADLILDLSRPDVYGGGADPTLSDVRVSLRVESSGGQAAADVRLFLDALESAYNGILSLSLALASGASFWEIQHFRLLPVADRLTLSSVELHSPGFWEFLGKLSPLEVLREYLKDRHERRKDREYREPAEAHRLELENQRLELENQRLALDVLERKLSLHRGFGATSEELAPILHALVFSPLDKLAQVQDKGLIKAVELVHPR